MQNKEYGSDFHYVNLTEFNLSTSKSSFLDSSTQLYFSGRAALRAILLHGISNYHWKKIYLPTYYCHEVFDFISDIGLELVYYLCNPLNNQLSQSIEDNKNNVLLIVDYFGVNSPKFNHLNNIIKIEDVTHNLDSINKSTADYVFGSLRKTLPIPVGGLVKSKEKLPNIGVSSYANEITQEKKSGMLLKTKYLNGEPIDKAEFRMLLIHAENAFSNLDSFSEMPNTIAEIIKNVDVCKILDWKKRNIQFVKQQIIENDKFKLVSSSNDTEYALILKFEKYEDREKLKQFLISKAIFPTVLWPNQLNSTDKEIEQTLLFLHLDFRYTIEDVSYIVNQINQYFLHAI
jgi:hypothetical protein